MLTIVGGLIKIPVPAFPTVFFTFQTVFVIMSGLVLGPKDGLFSQLAYMLIGLIGLPVFTQGGGIYYIFQPSFGYIIGFLAGAFLSGFLKSRFKTLSVLKLFFCAFFALASIYIIGMTYQFFIVWLFLENSVLAAFTTLSTLPFMFIIDAVMLYVICLLYPRINTLIGPSDPPVEKRKKPQNASTVNIEKPDQNKGL